MKHNEELIKLGNDKIDVQLKSDDKLLGILSLAGDFSKDELFSLRDRVLREFNDRLSKMYPLIEAQKKILDNDR